MALIHFIILLSAYQIFHVKGGIYTPHEDLPDGVITKYLKGKTKVSCVLQCERDGQCDEAMFKLNNKQKRSGECWFLKKKSNDTKDEIKDMKQDKSIESFKKIPICGKTPCYFGTCVKTDDSKGYKCECKDKWTLIQQDVCFGARPNEFGKFKIPHKAVINGIKLQHVGVGSLKCNEQAKPSKWGCDYVDPWTIEKVGVVITDEQRNILYPSTEYYVQDGYYSIPGFNGNSPYVIFNATNHTVYKGQELRLYFGEAFFNVHTSNNSGESCGDIYAIYCDP